MSALASSRDSVGSVPVITKVRSWSTPLIGAWGGPSVPVHARGAQLLHTFAIVGLREETRDGFREHGAHVVGFGQFGLGGVHQRIDAAEVAREVARRGLAHVTDAERVDEARQRGRLALLDRRDHVAGALVGHALQRGELGEPQLVELRRRVHDAGIHELVHELVAQSLDVERPAAREVQERLLALRRDTRGRRCSARRPRPAGAPPPSRTAGHSTGIANSRASAGRRSGTARTTCGITSPARRTITVSPMRRSRRRISSSLCSVTLVTVVPPTNTGARRATGVIAPVRPTCTSMARSCVAISSGGNLCATAQRGSRVRKPRSRCSCRLSTL